MSSRQRWIRDDQGVAMVVVLGVISVVTVLAVMAFVVSQQSLHESNRTEKQTLAFQAANAGLDAALAKFQSTGTIPTSGVVATGTMPGTGTYVVTMNPLGYSEYEATSVGTSREGATEIIKTKFFFLNLWEMNVAAGSLTAGGGGITGTSSVTGPFYVRGSMELQGGAFVHDGPLFIRDGDLTLGSGASEIGQPTKEIRLFCTGKYPPEGASGSGGAYYSYVSHSVPEVVLPPIDAAYLDQAWSTAVSESSDNKMGTASASQVGNYEADGTGPASYSTMVMPVPYSGNRDKAPGASVNYKVIGPDGGHSAKGMGATDLVINSVSFGKHDYVGPDGGIVHDDFAYDAATRRLYINGTVFVDGDVTFDGGEIYYVGNGTIVANGDITVNDDLVPYGTFADSVTNKQALGLVTPGIILCNAGDSNPRLPTDPPDVAGAWFGESGITFTANVLFRGSCMSRTITFGKPNIHMITNPALPTYLPDSLPGRDMRMLTRGNIARP